MTGRVEALTPAGRSPAGLPIWVLTDAGGPVQLWRGERDGPGAFQQATLDDLAAAVDRTCLTAASGQGFCLRRAGPDGDPVTSCFSWDGQPLDRIDPGTPPLETAGQLLTRASTAASRAAAGTGSASTPTSRPGPA